MATDTWINIDAWYQRPANLKVIGGFVIKRYDDNGCEIMVYSNVDNTVYVCRLE